MSDGSDDSHKWLIDIDEQLSIPKDKKGEKKARVLKTPSRGGTGAGGVDLNSIFMDSCGLSYV